MSCATSRAVCLEVHRLSRSPTHSPAVLEMAFYVLQHPVILLCTLYGYTCLSWTSAYLSAVYQTCHSLPLCEHSHKNSLYLSALVARIFFFINTCPQFTPFAGIHSLKWGLYSVTYIVSSSFFLNFISHSLYILFLHPLHTRFYQHCIGPGHSLTSDECHRVTLVANLT